MGPFPRALLIGCLSVMRWLCFVTGALLLILLVVQQFRGDEGAAPVQLGIGAVLMFAGGWISGWVSGWFERQV